MAEANIAVVSFERFLHGSHADRRAVAGEIYDAFSTVGWVYLVDHGISQARIEQIFSLNKDFFDKPLEEKLRFRLSDPAVNQGYTADGAEDNGGGVDHKECYEHRRFANPLCPGDDVAPGFRAAMDGFYAECHRLGAQVLRALALALGMDDERFFDRITARADPQLRVIHYPAIDRATVEQAGHARITPHTDFGLCTLLFQDSVGGLEVDPQHTGDFRPVTPIPGAVLINIADLLQRLTNGRCRSTLHRVVSPSSGGNSGGGGDSSGMLPARFSMPFFIHPDPEATIDPITLEPGEAKLYEPVNAGQWRTMHTARNYRLNASAG